MVGGSSTRFSSEAHLRIGRWLRSKWHLDSLIAIGGMASVYAGTHRNGARAAIKVLHAQYTRNEQARRRFLAEGYAANKVGHRNAVSVLDDDITEDGEVYLVMELLEGESFEGRLDRVGVMSPIECLQITEQMLEVLACAHTRGILHRDIKPANVFLCRDGSVKLLDFGLARVRELSAEALDQSDGIVFGTVSYIAPEQARADNQNLDARSDMWSVAATMFRALTGETVFPAEGPVIERLMAVARKPARSLASVDPRLPRLVVELVDRALAFDPDDRWPSANVMRVVVQDVLAQLTEEAEEAAGAVVQDEQEIEFHSPIFRRQPDSAPVRPRSDPAMTSPRPKTDPNAPRPAQPQPQPQSNPLAAAPRANRPKTDPFGVMPEDLRLSGEPSPLPEDADEVDLDVESLEAPSSGKRGRTRTLLTKEGRAELRRILDARRTQKAKGDPTPEPVHMPTPTPVATPTPTPTPAPVHIEAVAQVTPRVITQPSPVAAPVPVRRPITEPSPVAAPVQPVQPVRRATTEPSPVAAPIQPRPRVTTEPSPVAAPGEFAAGMSSVELTLDDEGSMLESGMVVIQPETEESIIELTIHHTRPGTSGTIAEPLADTTSRPGPADSFTTAAFPAIATPRARGPAGAATPDHEDTRVGSAPAATGRSTASYPAIGKPPAKSPPSLMTPPTRAGSEEVTKVGAAPQPPSAPPRPSQPAVEPKATAVPLPAPGTMRPEEPAGDVTKVTRIPLPTFGKPAAPAAPTGPAPGPLPSRSSLPPPTTLGSMSGEIGEERKPATAGRWTPPVAKATTSEPAKPAAKPTEPARAGLPGKLEPGKIDAPKPATPTKVEARPEPVKAEPVKAEPVKAEPMKAKFDPAKPVLTPSKSDTKPDLAKSEPMKPKFEPGKLDPAKPLTPAKVETKPQEVKSEPAKLLDKTLVGRAETILGKSVAATAAKPEAPRSDAKGPAKTDPAFSPKASSNKPESTTKLEPIEAKGGKAEPLPARAAPLTKPSEPVKPASAAKIDGSDAARPASAAKAEVPEPAKTASAAKAETPEPAKTASAAKTEAARTGEPVTKSPAASKAEAVKTEAVKVELEKPPLNDPAKSVAKPEAEAPAASKPPAVATPEPTPGPELKLPGAGLSRPAPAKSMFSVPYAGLGKTAERDKATSKPEPAEPAKGTPKKSS